MSYLDYEKSLEQRRRWREMNFRERLCYILRELLGKNKQ